MLSRNGGQVHPEMLRMDSSVWGHLVECLEVAGPALETAESWGLGGRDRVKEPRRTNTLTFLVSSYKNNGVVLRQNKQEERVDRDLLASNVDFKKSTFVELRYLHCSGRQMLYYQYVLFPCFGGFKLIGWHLLITNQWQTQTALTDRVWHIASVCAACSCESVSRYKLQCVCHCLQRCSVI